MYEHYLAESLGRTVAELRASLSAAEYLAWTRYHRLLAAQQEIRR